MNRLAPESSPLWEQVVGLVGALLVAALGVLLFMGDDSPPHVVATVQRVDVSPTGQFVATTDVHNAGGETVEDVVIVGELIDEDGRVADEAQAEVSFLPGGGSQRIALVFTDDPADFELRVRSVGWTDT